MLKFSLKGLLAFCLVATCVQAQEPQPSKPEKEHEWLQQLVGEWETHGKMDAAPGQEAFECHGSETTRSIGGLWVVAEGEAASMGMSVESVLTLGYDPAKKKFVGTWIDSMFNHLWHYEGTLDESGTVLTLLTEGPNFTKPGEMAPYKETLEFKDKDHKVFSSYTQVDGEWVKFMTVEGKRVK
ncbi:MAG: DUF1579 domain-containing protein [Planctomycetaceae bacterium]|nr:DUF1579 domain-containing protein [Planctomycetaceae bacterium]